MFIKGITISNKDVERFYNRIDIQEDDCWDISYAKDRDGYSKFGLYSKDVGVININSHRFMYLLHHQEIKEEDIRHLEVCHDCDNPGCVNPDHLILETHQYNVQDCVNKNRQSQGSSLPQSVFDESEIKEILEGILTKKYTSIKHIANYFVVSTATIGCLLNEKSWKSITKNYNMNKIRHMIIDYSKKSGKLSVDDVKNIRIDLKNNIKVSTIVKKFNIDSSTVYRIKSNKIHKI